MVSRRRSGLEVNNLKIDQFHLCSDASSIQISRADGKNERVNAEESANDNVLIATLTIASFQLEDATQYRCVAMNEQGQAAYDTAIIEHESDESFSFQTREFKSRN